MPGPQRDVLPAERTQVIVERLTREGRVFSGALAQEFETSEDTVRRHLRELAAAGLCTRVHGGAIRVSPASGSFVRRSKEDFAAKSRLAAAAAALVSSGQTIFIDAGTTNLALAKALPDIDLTIITNAPAIAAALAEKSNCSVIVLGGLVRRQTGGVTGGQALAALRTMRPDLTFLGACAVDPEEGISGFDAEDAEFKRALVACSRSLAILATSDKIGTGAPHLICGIEAVDRLIAESDIGEERAVSFRERGVAVVVAA